MDEAGEAQETPVTVMFEVDCDFPFVSEHCHELLQVVERSHKCEAGGRLFAGVSRYDVGADHGLGGRKGRYLAQIRMLEGVFFCLAYE